MTIADLGYFLAGTLALLAAAAKLHQARTSTSRSAGLIYLCMYMSTLGLACFMLAPSGLRFLAGLEPIPNLTRLAGNGLTACAVYSIMGTLSTQRIRAPTPPGACDFNSWSWLAR